MENKQASFLPFHAITQYMRDDYQHTVVHRVMTHLSEISDARRGAINRLIKAHVRVPGFRNPAVAPAAVKVVPTISAFQKRPDVAAAVLAAWMDTKTELRDQVFAMLQARGWELLPLDADRTKLPGFLPVWPKDEDFEVLNNAFKELYPETSETTDDVSLMAVWISGRLPFSEGEGEE